MNKIAPVKTPVLYIISVLLVFSLLGYLAMNVLGFIFGFSLSLKDILWGLLCIVVLPTIVYCTTFREGNR